MQIKLKEEKPYYYSSTVENGKVIEHEGDPKHAVYLSEINKSQKRSDLWHKWVEKNVPNAYNSLGVLDPNVYEKHIETCKEFMNGSRKI